MASSPPTPPADPAAPANARYDRGRIVELLDRYAARIQSGWLLFLALLAVELVPGAGISVLGLMLGEHPRVRALSFLENLHRNPAFALMDIGVITPLFETLMLWIVVRGGNALLRNADAAILIGTVLAALYHMPAAPLNVIGIGWGFLVYATILLSNRIDVPFLWAWALHGAHNLIISTIVLVAG